MKIAVIDAQGAGLGQAIIKKMRKEIEDNIQIIALGTNTEATSNMVRAGAHVGISGERGICSFLKKNELHAIIAPISMICDGGINSEIPSLIPQAIVRSNCVKYILPLQKNGIYIPGTRELHIKQMVEEIIIDIQLGLSDQL